MLFLYTIEFSSFVPALVKNIQVCWILLAFLTPARILMAVGSEHFKELDCRSMAKSEKDDDLEIENKENSKLGHGPAEIIGRIESESRDFYYSEIVFVVLINLNTEVLALS